MNRFHSCLARLTAQGLLLALLAGLVLQPAVLRAAEEEVPEGLVDLQELIRVIEIARESGFSEEEIKEITIEDGGRVIKALDYYNRILDQRAKRAAALKEREGRVYLTVDDIVKELVVMEPADLKRLREDLLVGK